LVKKLIGNNRVDKVIFRNNPDPGHKNLLPSHEDVKKYNIKISNGWIEKNEYKKLLSECNVFIAPRPYEGIGTSFLEALSTGMAVIAPNNATMNEYVVHNKNGYLYDLSNPKEINLNNITKIRKEAKKSAIKGFEKWKKEKYELLSFVNSSPITINTSKLLKIKTVLYFFKIFRLPYKIFRRIIKNFIN